MFLNRALFQKVGDKLTSVTARPNAKEKSRNQHSKNPSSDSLSVTYFFQRSSNENWSFLRFFFRTHFLPKTATRKIGALSWFSREGAIEWYTWRPLNINLKVWLRSRPRDDSNWPRRVVHIDLRALMRRTQWYLLHVYTFPQSLVMALEVICKMRKIGILKSISTQLKISLLK